MATLSDKLCVEGMVSFSFHWAANGKRTRGQEKDVEMKKKRPCRDEGRPATELNKGRRTYDVACGGSGGAARNHTIPVSAT